MYKRNIEVRSRNHFCREKAVSTTYCECESVALVIQHAMRVFPKSYYLPSVACLALQYFAYYKQDDHRHIVAEHKICVLIFYFCMKYF